MAAQPSAESTRVVAARVAAARAVQRERWRGLLVEGWALNAHVPGSLLRSSAWRLARATAPLDRRLERGSISLRGYDRSLRCAWTVADSRAAASRRDRSSWPSPSAARQASRHERRTVGPGCAVSAGGAGRKGIRELLTRHGATETLERIRAGHGRLARFAERVRRLDVDRDVATAAKVGARIVVPGDAEWPSGSTISACRHGACGCAGARTSRR